MNSYTHDEESAEECVIAIASGEQMPSKGRLRALEAFLEKCNDRFSNRHASRLMRESSKSDDACDQDPTTRK